MSKWNWKKMYFCHLNNKSVHLYESEKGDAQIRVESSISGKVYGFIDFSSIDEASRFVDAKVSDDDAFYNHARATQSLIDAVL